MARGGDETSGSYTGPPNNMMCWFGRYGP